MPERMGSGLKALLARSDPAWRFALGAFLAGRLFFSLWSAIVLAVVPLAVQNLTLAGEPVVSAFDLQTSTGYLFGRQVDGRILTFRADGPGRLSDLQTGSKWDLRSGAALTGSYAGAVLPLPVSSETGVVSYQGVAPHPSPLLAVWQRFDTNWYLKIARSGYTADDGSTAFFPLYPFLVRIAGSLLGDDLLAALLISNAALLGALVLLFKLASGVSEPGTVRRALLYMLLFPTSFFLYAAYTESLFLFLAAASFWSARRGNWPGSAAWAALAALTRLQGVLLLAPLAYLWLIQGKDRRPGQALLLLAVPMATAAFLLGTGFAFGADLQGHWRSQLVWPWQNAWAALVKIATGAGAPADALNLVLSALFVGLCAPAWRRLPRDWAVYMALMVLVPLFRMNEGQPLVSVSRYVLAAFPAFLVMGEWGRNPWANRLIVYGGFLAALYFSAQFLMWGWVA